MLSDREVARFTLETEYLGKLAEAKLINEDELLRLKELTQMAMDEVKAVMNEYFKG